MICGINVLFGYRNGIIS